MIPNVSAIAPRTLIAALVGAIVFVAVQVLAGATPITEFMGNQVVSLGGYPPALATPIGWAIHLGVSSQYALLFAAISLHPAFSGGRTARRAVLLGAAIVLGWVATLVTAPAIAVTVNVLAGQGLPDEIPGLYTKIGLPLWNHIGFFLVLFSILGLGSGSPAARSAGRQVSSALIVAAALVFATAAQAAERSGAFYPAEKRTAAGRATVTRADDGNHQITLSEDFASPKGPDLFVVLIRADEPKTGREVRNAGYVALGRLTSTKGGQTYAIPVDLDLAAYRTVGIWCEKFGVLFAAAPLSR